jgi:hypothetical protein
MLAIIGLFYNFRCNVKSRYLRKQYKNLNELYKRMTSGLGRPTCKEILTHKFEWTLSYKELRKILSPKRNIKKMNLNIAMKILKIFKERKNTYIYRLLKSMLKRNN